MRFFRGFPGLCALLLTLTSCAGNLTAAPDAAAVIPGCDGQGRSRCVASISVGSRFGCAALADQTVWCWGRDDESQLGYESTDLCPERLSGGQTRAVACHMYPLQVAGLAGVTAVSSGGAHSCAVLSSGELRCWGANTRGQLGNASVLPSRAPVAVAGLGPVISVAAGASHTCAVVEGGQVYCWGANDRGQLGVETSPNQCEVGGAMVACARAPVPVPDMTDAVEVVVGDAHTCVRATAGRVWCWGTNTDAQLGSGTASAMPTPTPQAVQLGASALRRVRSLAAGGQHTCAVRDDGAVLCWGRHDRGQLGVAVPESFEPCAHACIATAVPIVGYEGAPTSEDPDAGFEDPDGGSGIAPPMDASARPDASAPRDVMDASAPRDRADVPDVVDVPGDSGLPAAPTVVSVSAGAAFSCLSLSDRTVRCWGTNRTYELGNGQVNEGGAALTTVIASPGSAATNPLQGVAVVESGGSTTCALLADRSLRCWGTNEGGALGVGDVAERNGPVSMTW
jgi:alpha-tubulin suppressor-like RCC1 family protein